MDDSHCSSSMKLPGVSPSLSPLASPSARAAAESSSSGSASHPQPRAHIVVWIRPGGWGKSWLLQYFNVLLPTPQLARQMSSCSSAFLLRSDSDDRRIVGRCWNVTWLGDALVWKKKKKPSAGRGEEERIREAAPAGAVSVTVASASRLTSSYLV